MAHFVFTNRPPLLKLQLLWGSWPGSSCGSCGSCAPLDSSSGSYRTTTFAATQGITKFAKSIPFAFAYYTYFKFKF